MHVLRSHRLHLALLAIVAFLSVFAFLSRAAHGDVMSLSGTGVASLTADAGPVEVPAPAPPLPPAADIPDPEQDPGGFIDAALLFWRSGGKVPTVLVGLIGLLAVLKRRVAWLRVGWRVTAVGVVGVLVATLLDTWLSSGAAGNIWSWLFGGIVGVVNFLSNPRPTPAKAG